MTVCTITKLWKFKTYLLKHKFLTLKNHMNCFKILLIIFKNYRIQAKLYKGSFSAWQFFSIILWTLKLVFFSLNYQWCTGLYRIVKMYIILWQVINRFFFPIRWPIEPKFSQVCYLRIHQVRTLVFDSDQHWPKMSMPLHCTFCNQLQFLNMFSITTTYA